MATTTMKKPNKDILTYGSYSAFTATGINLVLFFLFMLTHVIDPNHSLTVGEQQRNVGILPVLIASIVTTYIAAFAWWIFVKMFKNPWRIYRVIAIILLLLSFLLPLKYSDQIPLGMMIALDLMHTVVVGCIFYFFPRSLAPVKEW
jgi:hypothetical protein